VKAIIAGAGLSGLTAANCLTRVGIECTVLERAPRLTEVGAGIQLSPNAMKVMQRLKLGPALIGAGFRPERAEMRWGESGRTIFSVPLMPQASDRWGAPYLNIHRADLLGSLAANLGETGDDDIRLGVGVVGYRQAGDGVAALLEDGSTVEGDLLIGADGIHSQLRTEMLGPESPRFTGMTAWRATVPISELGEFAPPPTACVWVGPGRHAVSYRLGDDARPFARPALANFVGVVERADWRSESWTEEGSVEEALADFDGFHPIVRRMIEKAPRHYRWALFDREPLARWTDGRVALIGDACHPMLPFLAQGAAMGMEDAAALGEELAAADDIPAALERYERRRMARATQVQAGARPNARLFHRRGPVARLATYLPMRAASAVAPWFIRSRLDWLYGYLPFSDS